MNETREYRNVYAEIRYLQSGNLVKLKIQFEKKIPSLFRAESTSLTAAWKSIILILGLL